MSELTLAILAETMFSGDLSGAIETIENYNQARNDAFTGVPSTRRDASSISTSRPPADLDEFIYGIIAARQAEIEPKDILGMLVHAVRPGRGPARRSCGARRDGGADLRGAHDDRQHPHLRARPARAAPRRDPHTAGRGRGGGVCDRFSTTAELDGKIPMAVR